MDRKTIDQLVCQKCGRPCKARNNLYVFNLLVGGFPKPTWVVKASHVTPVTHQGRIICKGEPDIYQYFKGRPKSKTSNYDKLLETKYRQIYKQLKII